jgi:hypothetical protein
MLTFLLFFLTTNWLLFTTLNFYTSSIHVPLCGPTVTQIFIYFSYFYTKQCKVCRSQWNPNCGITQKLSSTVATETRLWLTHSQTKGMYKADNLFLRLKRFSAPGQLPQSFGHWSPVIQAPPRCCRQPSSSHNNSSVKKRNQTRKNLFIRTTILSALKLGTGHVTTIEWCNRIPSEISFTNRMFALTACSISTLKLPCCRGTRTLLGGYTIGLPERRVAQGSYLRAYSSYLCKEPVSRLSCSVLE